MAAVRAIQRYSYIKIPWFMAFYSRGKKSESQCFRHFSSKWIFAGIPNVGCGSFVRYQISLKAINVDRDRDASESISLTKLNPKHAFDRDRKKIRKTISGYKYLWWSKSIQLHHRWMANALIQLRYSIECGCACANIFATEHPACTTIQLESNR